MPDPTAPEFRQSFRSRGISACLLLLVAAFCLLACTTRENDRADGSATSGPELTELFRIGDESKGDTLLFGSIEELVAVDRSGRIFVGEEQDPRIYAFTADGNLIQSIGNKGGGPGEFQRVGSIHFGPGDTLYVFDSQLDRISAYEPNSLELAYDFTVSEDSLGRPSRMVGVLETGFLVTYGWPVSPDDSGKERRRYVMRVDRSGQVLPPYVHYVRDYEWHFYSSGEIRGVVRMPFAREPVFRTGSDGSLYAGWTGSVDIAVIARDGSYSHAVTHAQAPVPLTREDIERFAETRPSWYRDAVLNVELPPNTTKPVYETFVVDERARIWLKITPPSISDTTALWLILDSESRLRGKVQLPESTNLRVIQGGRAYAVSRGEETVIVYQVQD